MRLHMRSDSSLHAFLLCCVAYCVASVSPVSSNLSATPPNVIASVTNGTAAKPSSPTTTECSLTSVHPVRDVMERLLVEGAKLIELELTVENYPPDFLQRRLKHVFQPSHWVRSTGREGRKLLTLEDNYDFMSLFILSMGVEKTNVSLVDSPRNCLKSLDEEETLLTFRRVLLNDFKPQGQQDGSLSADEHTCNMKITKDGKWAEFIYTCCHKNQNGDVVCDDVTKDVWTNLLLGFVLFVKVMVALFSPAFIPRHLYRDEFGSAEYIYHPSRPSKKESSLEEKVDEILHCLKPQEQDREETSVMVPETLSAGSQEQVISPYNLRAADHSQESRVQMKFTMKIEEDASSIEADSELAKKMVPLRSLKDMKNFKKLIMDTETCRPGGIYEVTFKRVRLSVKSRRLLDQNTVPVGIFKVLYNNLFRCRLRKLPVFEKCCRTKTRVFNLTWYQCARALSRLVLLSVCLAPWILRMWVYFTFEDNVVSEKKEMAKRFSLEFWSGSATLLLTPLHGLFILTYIILIVDFTVYGVLTRAFKETLRLVMTKSLDDMYDFSSAKLCEGVTKWLIWPCERFGALGILLYLPYLVVLLLLGLPVVAIYIFPALHLTARLVHYLAYYVAQSLAACGWKPTSEHNWTWLKRRLEDRSYMRLEQSHFVQIVVIVMCFFFFWSLTFLFVETVTFFVEVGVYALTGIIVNAEHTLDYVTVAVFVVLYARTTFSGVYTKYLTYHQQIHEELLKMKKGEIKKIATLDESVQGNTAYHVEGYEELLEKDMEGTRSPKDIVKLQVQNGRPRFHTRGILLFLDERDIVYTPEWFFYEVISLKHPEAPGPLYVSLGKAFRNFGCTLLFLFFVFTVVMAFGDTYKVSPTNKLLATVAGSFIPFLFRKVFSPSSDDSPIDTESIQFKEELQKVITNYEQQWSVFDFGSDKTDTFDGSESLWFLPSFLEVKRDASLHSAEDDEVIHHLRCVPSEGSLSMHGDLDIAVSILDDDKDDVTIQEVEIGDVETVDMIIDSKGLCPRMCQCVSVIE